MVEKLELAWWSESCDLSVADESGSRLRAATAAPMITTNVYCEQPYCSADGNRIALHRRLDPGPTGTISYLLVYDIAKYKLAHLQDEVTGIANAAHSGVLFVSVGTGKNARLVRFDLNTLEREELFPLAGLPAPHLMTVSADNRYGLTQAQIKGGEQKFGIYRIDLRNGNCELLHDDRYICNSHLQYRLFSASRILLLENRGCEVDDLGNVLKAYDERGAGHYTIASDGSDRRNFPVGLPDTPGSTGHQCWVGDTDRVLVTLSSVWNDGTKTGNVLELSHDWEKARVVLETPHVWNHVSTSRCGRYFVVDSYEVPGVPILLGSIASGKTRELCLSKTSGGGAQFTHAHPYITADSKFVVFVSDRAGVSQTYIASIPEGFLNSLD